jgi:hypothetical protein
MLTAQRIPTMMRAIFRFYLAALAATCPLRAELPPSAYQERQDQAPEALVIRVRKVEVRERKEEKWTETHFVVRAEVEKVQRTASSLSPGSLLEIHYSRRSYTEPIAGPSEVAALKEGQVCPAYLRKEGGAYVPAAGGYSFETVQ